jgi:peptide/nickel transport system permease protein
MQEGIQYLSISPWISVFPGIFILVTALGFSLIGDSLREEVDPKLRRRWRLWF